jgi:predicted MFS family arabinose efflux permease
MPVKDSSPKTIRPPDTGKKTFRWDVLRGVSHGAMSALMGGCFLLIAIKYFDATSNQKSIIAASNFVGLLLSVVYAAWTPVLGRKTLSCALPTTGVALGLLIAAQAKDAVMYTVGTSVAGVCISLAAPILTAIYRDNYAGTHRGRIFGIVVVISGLASVLAQYLGAQVLELALDNFRNLYIVMAGLALTGGFAILRIPSKDEGPADITNPLTSLKVIVEHPRFGYVLGAWFLFGLANLSLMPQRFEYLSQAQYGFALSSAEIIYIVVLATEISKLLSTPFWAYLFDRFNFIKLRMAMTILIGSHVLIYYNAHEPFWLVVGSVLLGTAFGGGHLAWTLWVTKFAAPEETARYMSVHTFFNGIRGVIGPWLGYMSVEHLGIRTTAWIGAGIIFLSVALLYRIRNQPTRLS